MINISTLKIGEKVHYVSHEGAAPENGRVKEIPDHTNTAVRVVFHCAGEWDRFMDYTSQLTPIDKLKMGWSH